MRGRAAATRSTREAPPPVRASALPSSWACVLLLSQARARARARAASPPPLNPKWWNTIPKKASAPQAIPRFLSLHARARRRFPPPPNPRWRRQWWRRRAPFTCGQFWSERSVCVLARERLGWRLRACALLCARARCAPPPPNDGKTKSSFTARQKTVCVHRHTLTFTPRRVT